MKLTAIDKQVRSCLLSYPTLFSDRMDVLRQLFITYGNGYDWHKTKAGYVLKSYDDKKLKTMDYSDLDKRSAENAERMAEYDEAGICGLYKAWEVEIERDRLLREHRERHIDVYTTETIGTFGRSLGSDIFRHIAIEYSYLLSSRTPWGEIELSHVKAMEQMINALSLTFNQTYSLHSDIPSKWNTKVPEPSMYSRMPERDQKVYERMQEVRLLLDKQSGSLKGQIEAQKMLQGILDDVEGEN